MKLNKKIRKPFLMTAKTVKNNRLMAVDKIAQLEAKLKGFEIEQNYLLKQISAIAGIPIDSEFLYSEKFNDFRKTQKGFASAKMLMLGSRYATIDGMIMNLECIIPAWKGVERALSKI